MLWRIAVVLSRQSGNLTCPYPSQMSFLNWRNFGKTPPLASRLPNGSKSIKLKENQFEIGRNSLWEMKNAIFFTRCRPVLSTSLWTMATNDHSAQFGALDYKPSSMSTFWVSKAHFRTLSFVFWISNRKSHLKISTGTCRRSHKF